jgi:hypothetical protein
MADSSSSPASSLLHESGLVRTEIFGFIFIPAVFSSTGVLWQPIRHLLRKHSLVHFVGPRGTVCGGPTYCASGLHIRFARSPACKIGRRANSNRRHSLCSRCDTAGIMDYGMGSPPATLEPRFAVLPSSVSARSRANTGAWNHRYWPPHLWCSWAFVCVCLRYFCPNSSPPRI